MKTSFNTNMFDSIKGALEKAKSKQGGQNYKNILSLAAPGTYVVRLLPNIKNTEETFFHYFDHGWNSIKTGQYASITSPSTWGERCPISELYFKILRDGTEEDKERAQKLLRRKEHWMVNVYVVSDPKTPANNGTIKVLRYGKQLDKIFHAAIFGDDAEEFGAKIFDLSDNGCNLRIKAELVSDNPKAPKFASYTASKFLAPSEIEGLTEDKISEIYNTIYNLSSFVEHKTVDEIQAFISANYYAEEGAAPAATTTPAPVGTPVAEDDIPYDTPAKVLTTVVVSEESASKVKNILDGLDNLT